MKFGWIIAMLLCTQLELNSKGIVHGHSNIAVDVVHYFASIPDTDTYFKLNRWGIV